MFVPLSSPSSNVGDVGGQVQLPFSAHNQIYQDTQALYGDYEELLTAWDGDAPLSDSGSYTAAGGSQFVGYQSNYY